MEIYPRGSNKMLVPEIRSFDLFMYINAQKREIELINRKLRGIAWRKALKRKRK